jgi:hypothetical protein
MVSTAAGRATRWPPSHQGRRICPRRGFRRRLLRVPLGARRHVSCRSFSALSQLAAVWSIVIVPPRVDSAVFDTRTRRSGDAVVRTGLALCVSRAITSISFFGIVHQLHRENPSVGRWFGIGRCAVSASLGQNLAFADQKEGTIAGRLKSLASRLAPVVDAERARLRRSASVCKRSIRSPAV